MSKTNVYFGVERFNTAANCFLLLLKQRIVASIIQDNDVVIGICVNNVFNPKKLDSYKIYT